MQRIHRPAALKVLDEACSQGALATQRRVRNTALSAQCPRLWAVTARIKVFSGTGFTVQSWLHEFPSKSEYMRRFPDPLPRSQGRRARDKQHRTLDHDTSSLIAGREPLELQRYRQRCFSALALMASPSRPRRTQSGACSPRSRTTNGLASRHLQPTRMQETSCVIRAMLNIIGIRSNIFRHGAPRKFRACLQN